MGYHTDFDGCFQLNKPLTKAHKAYLTRFNKSRRMKRDAGIAAKFTDPLRKAVKLSIGEQGQYYVGTVKGDKETIKPDDPRYCDNIPIQRQAHYGQRHDASVRDYNNPPDDQPGLWCQWTPTEDGSAIEWDGGEKFYYYVEWLQYLIDNFLQPWGYTLNGKVKWKGEEKGDRGTITVTNNKVSTNER